VSTDTLDSLTDSQLSEAFAVECAGWAPKTIVFEGDDITLEPPSYATSGDAVLPFLVDAPFMSCWSTAGGWVITINDGAQFASAKTFSRAACIALLRAKRAAKPAVSELIDGC